MRGVGLFDVDIHGEIVNVTINGVDVGPLVNDELDRRYPERAKMRPTDPAGFRAAWDVVERLWGGTVERARRLDPALLHESVGGEWSFVETLRHLVFATDAWSRRAILGDPSPLGPQRAATQRTRAARHAVKPACTWSWCVRSLKNCGAAPSRYGPPTLKEPAAAAASM